MSGTHTITFTRAANDDITFTFTNLYIDGAIGPTNPEGVTTADIVGRPMSIGITANDGNSDY